ncbi:MAG: hypothetical protein HN509_16945 [Halobacteriovoraceae bacterium]|nr:hypothetical protein [Halobacteriovoraceae bacterium]MBT5093795.1 hypothetical protein [Halobacteriovoraceae bacterium]
MKHVLSIAFTEDFSNFDQVIQFNGESIRLTQYSTNFDLELTLNLLERFDGLCDSICISGLPPIIKGKKINFSHPQREKLMNATKETNVLDGQLFKDIYIPWVIRKYCYKNDHLFKNKDVSIYCGSIQKNLLEVMDDLAGKLFLADPYFGLKLPYVMNGVSDLDKFLKMVLPLMGRMKIKRNLIPSFSSRQGKVPRFLKSFFEADVFVANMATLELIDLSHLKGKTLIVDVLNEDLKDELRRVGVLDVMVCLPQIEGIPFFNFAIFEALLQGVQAGNKKLETDDLLGWIDEMDIRPEFINFKRLLKTPESATNFYYFS